jgi:putative restriction endonuclease
MENISVSKQLFYQLVELLKGTIVSLSFSESEKWCGLFQKGGKRFAYVLLAKRKPKIDVWCFGNVEYVKSKYSRTIKFLPRQETSGGFGKEFQVSFVIENLEDIKNAVLLLTEVSDSWTRDELISAYNLYCKIPVDEISSRNSKIIEFAYLLGREPKEVAKRFSNFSKLDATINVLENIDEEDKNTRNNFNQNWNELAYESESKIIDFENKLKNISEFPKGKERQRLVKTRVDQNFFRKVVLSSYKYKCCITGLPIVELLQASHIKPWKEDETNRLNPRNGLCLNVLHHLAFDNGFISITPDFVIKISKHINKYLDYKSVKDFFSFDHNQKITLPNRFLPDKSFLEYHYKNKFEK